MRAYRPELWTAAAFALHAAVLGAVQVLRPASALTGATLFNPALALACIGATVATLGAHRARAHLSAENFPHARWASPALAAAATIALGPLVIGARRGHDLAMLLMLGGAALAAIGLARDPDRRPAVLALALAAQVWMVAALTQAPDPRGAVRRTYAAAMGTIARWLPAGWQPRGEYLDTGHRRRFHEETIRREAGR